MRQTSQGGHDHCPQNTQAGSVVVGCSHEDWPQDGRGNQRLRGDDEGWQGRGPEKEAQACPVCSQTVSMGLGRGGVPRPCSSASDPRHGVFMGPAVSVAKH